MSVVRNTLDIINPDEGDGATARQGSINFYGFSNGEDDISDVFAGTAADIADPHILAQILVDHEGTSADDKGEIYIKVNDGDDGQAPSKTALQVHSNAAVTFSNDILNSATGAVQMAVGTTAQRAAVQGAIRYNTTTSQFEGYSGSAWAGLGGLIDVDQDTKITAEASAGGDEDVLTGSAGGTTTFTSNSTLFFSNQPVTAKTSTGALLTLQTSDTDIADGDVLGGIKFQAPNEATGTDAIALAGSIVCIAETDFSATVNKTEMVFKTAASGAEDVTNVTMHSNAAVTFAGTIIESSARELKENIEPLSGSLDKIMAMQGVTFNWKDDNRKTLGKDVGMIADDVSEVFPELVSYENEKPSGIKYSKMVSLLVEGMKEQQTQIEDLKAEIKALKN